MRELLLTLACGQYDRTEALLNGTLQPEGIRLNTVALAPPETFWRMLRYIEFDVSEMSISAYFALLSRGEDRFVAIPAFLSRAFRHSSLFVHAQAGIETPQDLRGKRVGCPEYHLTTAVWVRGLLEHEYGVRPQDFHWYAGGQQQAGRKERIRVDLPPGVRLESIPSDRTLDEMLESGELDAMIAPDVPAAFARGAPQIRRLFPDFQRVEQDYYRRTGIFPIMHTVVVRADVYRQHPWVAQSLYKAFVQAKDEALAAVYNSNALRYSSPWLVAELEAARAAMGADFWPYGLEANRATLLALQQYMREQGLLERDFPLEQAFAPSTLDTYRH